MYRNLFFLILDELIQYSSPFDDGDKLFDDFFSRDGLSYHDCFIKIFNKINIKELTTDQIGLVLTFFRGLNFHEDHLHDLNFQSKFPKYKAIEHLNSLTRFDLETNSLKELILKIQNLNCVINPNKPDKRYINPILNYWTWTNSEVQRIDFNYNLIKSLSKQHYQLKFLIDQKLHQLDPKLQLLVLVVFWFSTLEVNYPFFSANNIIKCLNNDIISEYPKPFNIFNYRTESIYIMDNIICLDLNFMHFTDFIKEYQFYIQSYDLLLKPFFYPEDEPYLSFKHKNFMPNKKYKGHIEKIKKKPVVKSYSEELLEESKIFDLLPQDEKLIFYNYFYYKASRLYNDKISEGAEFYIRISRMDPPIEDDEEVKIVHEKMVYMEKVLNLNIKLKVKYLTPYDGSPF